MKIKKSIVEQIIKEEAMKVKKLKILSEEKKTILKQLNELYEEAPEESVVDEDVALTQIPQDVLAIIPPEEMGEFKQSVQQAQTQTNASPEQPAQTLEEGFGGVIGDKIKAFVMNLFKGLSPEQSQALQQDVQNKFGNMGFKEIFRIVKDKMKTATALEEGKMSLRDIVKYAILSLGIGGATVAAQIGDKFADKSTEFVSSGMDAVLGTGGAAIFVAALVTFLIMHVKDMGRTK